LYFLKNNQVMLNLFQHPIRTVIHFTGIAKHVFYFASEMPICIGMTPHFISYEHLWAAAERQKETCRRSAPAEWQLL
jgi:hypothetical protein